MISKRLAVAFISGLAIVGAASPACAVNISPNGLGQVLIYPYYTVNAHQQTMVSVVNTTGVGKVVKVRFREAYNGRVVLQFNLYLSLYDVWTGTVFALSDTSIDSDFAGIFTYDNSCTDPPLTSSGTIINGTARYLRFTNDHYTGGSADTGPSGDARTREGHIEMILMSDVAPNSALHRDIVHINSVPPGCTPSLLQNASGYSAPTLDPATGAAGTLADGGLFGSASIVNVGEGVFYAYNADALDGFSYRSLYTLPNDAQPTLASVNDRNDANSATARVFANGEYLSATFPSTASGSRVVDAVSAVFAAGNVYNEYITSTDGSTGTDWVVTLPTKHLYVDRQPGGAIAGVPDVFAPFERPFGASNDGRACVTTTSSLEIFDRDEYAALEDECIFSAGCPPGLPGADKLCLETNVLSFFAGGKSVLGAEAMPGYQLLAFSAAGWLKLDLSQPVHQLRAATNGNIFHGLPLTGFAATKFVNGAVSVSDGGLAVANYTGVYHHRTATQCTNGDAPCQ